MSDFVISVRASDLQTAEQNVRDVAASMGRCTHGPRLACHGGGGRKGVSDGEFLITVHVCCEAPDGSDSREALVLKGGVLGFQFADSFSHP